MSPGLATLLAVCRVSNLPTVWMNVLTAGVLAAGSPPAGFVFLLMLAASASYCGGMVLNDYFDREFDAREQPFRPIPSGRMGVAAARRLAAGLLGAGVGLLLLQPHPSAVVPGLLLVGSIYAYDRWHKAHALSVLLMGAARALVFVVTSWAVIGAVTATVVVAGALSFAWTLLVTLVSRYESRRGSRFEAPVIPWLIASMAILDGLVLAVFVAPAWLLAGLLGAALTRFAQRYVRGD